MDYTYQVLETWVNGGIFCPKCGSKETMAREPERSEHMCTMCNVRFDLSNLRGVDPTDPNSKDGLRLKALGKDKAERAARKPK